MKKQILLIGTIVILITVGFSGCLEEKSDNQDISKGENSEEVILTTDKNEYISGEKLILTFVNNKNHSIFNQGVPLSTPSPIKSFDYGLQEFINGSWDEFQLFKINLTIEDIPIDDVVSHIIKEPFNQKECIEYLPQSTNLESISLTFFVYSDSGVYYENIPPGRYRIIKGFYNECINDFSGKNWSEPFTVYSNEFIIFNSTKDVLVITEKVEYQQGETINFTIYSSSGKICYLFYEGSECYRNEELFKIHFLNDSNWTNIPIGPDPSDIICPQWMPLGPRVKCISTPYVSSWDQQQRNLEQVTPGTYRIAFIDISGEEGEIFNLSRYHNSSKIYYSNEFTINENATEDYPFDNLINLPIGDGLNIDLNGKNLTLTTNNIYSCCNYLLNSTAVVKNSSIIIDVLNVIEPEECLTAEGPAIYKNDLGAIKGEYLLTIKYNGSVYGVFFLDITDDMIWFIKA